jgi:hypothetical protein
MSGSCRPNRPSLPEIAGHSRRPHSDSGRRFDVQSHTSLSHSPCRPADIGSRQMLRRRSSGHSGGCSSQRRGICARPRLADSSAEDIHRGIAARRRSTVLLRRRRCHSARHVALSGPARVALYSSGRRSRQGIGRRVRTRRADLVEPGEYLRVARERIRRRAAAACSRFESRSVGGTKVPPYSLGLERQRHETLW